MQRRLRHVGTVLFGAGLLAACAVRPQSSPGNAACTAKDKSKYDPAAIPEIEARLSREAARASWEEVPEPYRAWGADRLTLKVQRAAATLADSHDCREIEAAAAKVVPLGKRIAEAAKKCTDEQCVTKHSQPAALESELELALCPLYPFC
jgi:hypothetical protein